MSDDEILFDDIYELHEVIGERRPLGKVQYRVTTVVVNLGWVDLDYILMILHPA